jgi:hypothetical protein
MVTKEEVIGGGNGARDMGEKVDSVRRVLTFQFNLSAPMISDGGSRQRL